MKLLLPLCCLFSLCAFAHPGIGIVVDSRDNIYYTDLRQVWKISPDRKITVVPGVHTHELYIDANDVLYGEDLQYDAASGKFYHSYWALKPDGRLDTIISKREAYVQEDFSLARDAAGNEYFINYSGSPADTSHIFKRTRTGKLSIYATGQFGGVRWLHARPDGSLYYINNNSLFKVSPGGNIRILATHLAGTTAPGSAGRDIINYGVWEDASSNIYVAVFSDKMVKKILPDGKITDYYHSKGDWSPTHGVFDSKGQLWLMECSKNNDIRVIQVDSTHSEKADYRLAILVTILLLATVITTTLIIRNRRKASKPIIHH